MPAVTWAVVASGRRWEFGFRTPMRGLPERFSLKADDAVQKESNQAWTWQKGETKKRALIL